MDRYESGEHHAHHVDDGVDHGNARCCATVGPLARGCLAGNRKRGQVDATLRERHDEYGHGLYYTEADYQVADRVVEIAAEKGVRPAQIALAWILHQSDVTAPIVSVTKLEQLDDRGV